MKPTAWYDPSNGMVSTDKDCPLFTPLGQVWPLYLERTEQKPVAWEQFYTTAPQRTWIETNNSVCAILRQAHDMLAMSSLPPKREWVGLTLEQYVAINSSCTTVDQAVGSTERQLKENNT